MAVYFTCSSMQHGDCLSLPQQMQLCKRCYCTLTPGVKAAASYAQQRCMASYAVSLAQCVPLRFSIQQACAASARPMPGMVHIEIHTALANIPLYALIVLPYCAVTACGLRNEPRG
jgi:hypothetical protein